MAQHLTLEKRRQAASA